MRTIKTSLFDLFPSSLLRESTDVFAPVLAHGQPVRQRVLFPSVFKTVQVLPLRKKSGLDTAILSNVRPVSNLSTVFKIVERHLQGSQNFSVLQFACRDGHSTETAVLIRVSFDLQLK